MTKDEFLQRWRGATGKEPKGSGRQYKGICPAHDDKEASLSVKFENSKILLHCHAGCDTAAVIEAMGLKTGDLFEQPQNSAVQTAVYPYYDSNGQLIAEKVRKPGKKFTWRRPDGIGGYQYGLGGVQIPLYNLSAIKDSPYVFLVEGEKDVETLKRLCQPAVSGANGAARWEDHYTPALQGKKVMIIPDNDKPGREYALKAAAALKGTAKSVHIMNLAVLWPEIPEKADITDYINAKGQAGIAELMNYFDQVPEHIGGHEVVTVDGAQNCHPLPAIPLPEVYNLHWLGHQDLKPVDFIVKGLLPVGLSLLASPPKFGKSYFVFNLAICVAGGEKFLDRETQKCGVLYLALEDSLNRLQGRAFQLLGTRDLPKGVFLMLEIGDLSNGFKQQLEAVLDENPEIKLVIIDTLQFIRGTFNRNEGAYAVDYREMREIKAIASERNICILLVHHTRKMKDESDPFANVSGTTGITGAMDTTLILKKDDRMKEDEKTYLYITGRDVEQNAFTMSFNNGKWSIVGTVAEEEAKQEFADYMKNPTVTTIRTLVNQHHGRWEGKTSELMSAGKYIAKCNLAPNLQTLGKSFGKLEDQLFKYDNILHDVAAPNGSGGKIHIFFNPQLEEIEGFTEIKDSS